MLCDNHAREEEKGPTDTLCEIPAGTDYNPVHQSGHPWQSLARWAGRRASTQFQGLCFLWF